MNPPSPCPTLAECALDSVPWRVSERIHAQLQQIRRHASARRATAAPTRAAPPLLSPLVELEAANAQGAFTTAARLSMELENRLSELPPAVLPRALCALLEARIAQGDRTGASAIALQQRRILEKSPQGATLLTLLGVELPQSVWLPGGRPNLLASSQAIETGSLSASDLCAALWRRPWRWQRHPELYLLAFNALRRSDVARAERFLNRFLRVHGLPRCELRPKDPFFSGLIFDRGRRIHRGPSVSVAMAVRNAATTVRYAVDSLLAQTYEPLEILIADDASSDDTLDILRREYLNRSNVRVFRSERPQGPYNLRNALFAQARGTLLAVHDADDLALPTRLELQVAKLRLGRVGACIANWVRFRPDGAAVFFRDQRAVRLSLVSLLMERQVFERFGPFRTARFGADLEFYEDLRAKLPPSAIARVRTPLLFGLWSPSSLTRSPNAEALEDGYRSEARRAYAEAVFHKRQRNLTSTEIEEVLRRTENYVEPCPVVEVVR